MTSAEVAVITFSCSNNVMSRSLALLAFAAVTSLLIRGHYRCRLFLSTTFLARLSVRQCEDKIKKKLQQTTFFSQLRSRLSAQLMSRSLTFSRFWRRKLVILAMSEIQLLLFQRVSVLVQRFNGVLLHDSFVFEDCPE